MFSRTPPGTNPLSGVGVDDGDKQSVLSGLNWQINPNALDPIDAAVEHFPDDSDCHFAFEAPPFQGGPLAFFVPADATRHQRWTSLAALYSLVFYVVFAIIQSLTWQVAPPGYVFIALLVSATVGTAAWLQFSKDCTRLPYISLVVGTAAVILSMFGDSCAPFSIGGGAFLLHSVATVATLPAFGARLPLTAAACFAHFVAVPVVFAVIDGTAGQTHGGLGCFVDSETVHPVSTPHAVNTTTQVTATAFLNVDATTNNGIKVNTATSTGRKIASHHNDSGSESGNESSTPDGGSSTTHDNGAGARTDSYTRDTATTPVITNKTARSFFRTVPLLLPPIILLAVAARIASALMRQRSRCDHLACAVEIALEHEAMSSMADIAEEHVQRTAGMSLLEEAMCDLAVEAHSIAVAFNALQNLHGTPSAPFEYRRSVGGSVFGNAAAASANPGASVTGPLWPSVPGPAPVATRQDLSIRSPSLSPGPPGPDHPRDSVSSVGLLGAAVRPLGHRASVQAVLQIARQASAAEAELVGDRPEIALNGESTSKAPSRSPSRNPSGVEEDIVSMGQPFRSAPDSALSSARDSVSSVSVAQVPLPGQQKGPQVRDESVAGPAAPESTVTQSEVREPPRAQAFNAGNQSLTVPPLSAPPPPAPPSGLPPSVGGGSVISLPPRPSISISDRQASEQTIRSRAQSVAMGHVARRARLGSVFQSSVRGPPRDRFMSVVGGPGLGKSPNDGLDALAQVAPRARSKGLTQALDGFSKSAARRHSVAVSRLMRRNSSQIGAATVAATVAPVVQRRSFVACFSLPNLDSYCRQKQAAGEMVQLIVTGFADTVSKALREYNGEMLFTDLDEIFCAFEDCGSACAAGLRVKGTYLSDTTQFDKLYMTTRPAAPFVQIMHSAVMTAELGAASGRGSSMGWCECRAVMHVVKTHIARAYIDPPAVLLADSIAHLVKADFEAEPHTEFVELIVVTGAKATTAEGHPMITDSVANRLIGDAAESYTLPDASDLLKAALMRVDNAGDFDDDDSDDGFFTQSAEPVHQGTTFAMLAAPPLMAMGLLGESGRAVTADASEGMTAAQQKQMRLKWKKMMKKYKKLDPVVLELWHKFDADGNGQLDVEEVYDMLMELDVTLDNESFEKFFMELDEDGNGFVTLDEFANAFTSHQGMVSGRIAAEIKKVAEGSDAATDNLPMLRAVWRKYDPDIQGSLPPSDVQKVLGEFGIKRTIQEVELLVEKVDNNGNHMMEFEELAELFNEGGAVSATKTTARRDRMMFVNRLMGDLAQGTLYSTTEQVERDRVVSVTEFLRLYMSPVMILYIVYNASINLFRVVMGSREHTPHAHIAVDMILDIVLYFWFVVKLFFSARETRGEVLHTRWDVWRVYVPTVEFAVDVLAVLPLDVAFLACGGLDNDVTKCGEYGYYRVNKILLVYHFTTLFANVSQLLRPTVALVLESMVWFVSAAHLFACAVIALTRIVGQENMDTMLFADKILETRSTLYLQAFLWALQSLAGQVRGPVLQEDDKQVVLMLAAVAVGIPLLAAMLATIGNILHTKSAESAFLQRIDQVRSYFSYVAQANPLVDLDAEQDVIMYYRHMYFTTGSLDVAANPLKDVPVELSIQMTITTGLEMLRKVPIFQEACENLEFVHEMASKLTDRVLEPSVTVMTKGERGTDMYFITHGDCHVVTEHGARVFTLKKGNFFGEIALLHKVKRTATIENGDRYTNVLRLDKRDFDEVMETFPQCLIFISKAAQGRLDEILAKEAAEARAEKERLRASRLAQSMTMSLSKRTGLGLSTTIGATPSFTQSTMSQNTVSRTGSNAVSPPAAQGGETDLAAMVTALPAVVIDVGGAPDHAAGHGAPPAIAVSSADASGVEAGEPNTDELLGVGFKLSVPGESSSASPGDSTPRGRRPPPKKLGRAPRVQASSPSMGSPVSGAYLGTDEGSEHRAYSTASTLPPPPEPRKATGLPPMSECESDHDAITDTASRNRARVLPPVMGDDSGSYSYSYSYSYSVSDQEQGADGQADDASH